MNKKREGKITLGMLKGKPVATSVPSISIRFHANAEQLEELYASDEESHTNNESVGTTGASTSAGVSEAESSPLKYLPRLVKRSTSIDITPASTNVDASPPSDPWRFFSDIKGKITKSVEEKITEIKARNQEEGSPLKIKTVKDSKDNSSVSDSEDLSESSISKTCGIVSTTEGAEMSSDEDTPPSIEKDADRTAPSSSGGGLRQRFRLLRPKQTKEGTVGRAALARLCNINADRIEQALPEHQEAEVEDGVDALAETTTTTAAKAEDEVLEAIEKYDNVRVDEEGVVVVREVGGKEVKRLHWATRRPKTVYAPVGFVDMREPPASVQRTAFVPVIVVLSVAAVYYIIYRYSNYLAGFLVGATITYLYHHVKITLDSPVRYTFPAENVSQEIVEVQAVEECQPFSKYEGWMNEFPEVYNPHTYHISQTQSVYLRLQGNLLRVSHSRTKVPKRALWNEHKHKPVFTHHRVYNMLGAQVCLLPEGLAKKRHWSKKYPICVTLGKDQLRFEEATASSSVLSVRSGGAEEEEEAPTASVATTGKAAKRTTFGFATSKRRKKAAPVAMTTQRFSKLTEENEEYEMMESENSRGSSPSPDFMHEEVDETERILQDALSENLRASEEFDEEFEAHPEDWEAFTPEEESPNETKLYLFGRTDREKEDWFRRLKAAVHKGANLMANDTISQDASVSNTLVDAVITEMDYVRFMSIFYKQYVVKKVKGESSETVLDEASPSGSGSSSSAILTAPLSADLQWINAFCGRILFDCLRDDNFTFRIKEKIQKKMASIKLPYFIEELLVTELSLGQTPPVIRAATRPVLDDRGLWIDLDIAYEGLVVLILQTKLNLMKLKQPHLHESSKKTDRPAMFNSDVEDSAESSTDDDTTAAAAALFSAAPNNNHPHNQQQQQQQTNQGPVLDSSGVPVQGLGGTSNTSKKFMKMVDRIAESKFFQAATEYRYIKRAMEGVSNTDLRLKVEVKELTGTLVLNVPPPPSDRIWVSFRPVPELGLKAQPIVGERNITFLRIISWIEKKLVQEFQKLLVIPNMEDFIIPVMCPKLPQ